MLRKLHLYKISRILAVAFVLAILLSIFIPVSGVLAVTRDLYWIGGSGNWSDVAHWSLASGGAGGEAIPDSDDNVIFDASSDLGATYSVSVNSSTRYCLNMDWTGAQFNPGFSCNAQLHVYGSLTFISGMTVGETGDSYIKMMGAGTHNFTSGSVTIYPGLRFSGGGSYTLQDELIVNGNAYSSYGILVENASTLITNNENITVASDSWLSITGAGSTFTAGSSTVTTGRFSIDAASTINAGTSTIIQTCNSSTFAGGGKTFNVVQLTGSSQTMSGNNTITTASFTGATPTISGACTFTTLNVTGTAILNNTLTLGANQTVTGTLNIDGNSQVNRLVVNTNTLGTARTLTLTGATVSGCSNVDFYDITATPSIDLSSITGGSGNVGGNSGITFTTATSRYWVGNTGNWSDTSHWSATSGGAGGATMPLVQDTAYFDASSFTIATRTVTVDVPYVGNINSSEVINAPTIYSASAIAVYGDLIMGANYWTATTGTYFSDRSSPVVDTQGYSLTGDVYTYPYGTTLTLSSDLVLTGTLYHRAGTLDFVAYDVSATYFDSSTTTYTRTLSLGSGTIFLSGTAATTKWNVNATNFTLSANTSLIVLSNSGANAQTFAGGTGITTYYGLMISGAGNYTTTFSVANTFSYIWIDRGDAAKTISGNVTLTVSALVIPINGVVVVTVANTDFSKASGTVVTDYLNFNSGANTCTAAGGATFYAGVNSITAPQTGWIFTDAPTPFVSTLGVEDITNNSATLNGNLDTLDGETTGYVYFQYGTTTSYGSTTTQTGKSSVGGFNVGVTGLSSGTVYHYRAVFRYDGTSYVYGNDLTLTTTSTPGAPIVITGSSSNVDTNTATLNGGITSLGDATVVYASFEYGTDTTYGNATGEEFINVAGTAFTADISSLTPGITYHFRARARYVVGSTSYYATGGDVTFTTLLASGASTIITIRDGNTAVFNNYFESGDMLLTAEIINTYTGYYPDKDPQDYFQVQLLNAAGTAILGATPLWAWGDIPVSILFRPYQVNGGTLTNGTGTATGSPITLSGATTVQVTAGGNFTIVLPPGDGGTAVSGTAAIVGSPVTLVSGSNTIVVGGAGTIVVTPTNLVLESAYILRVQGIGGLSTLAPKDYTLIPSDWKGTDLTNLDDWMKGVAYNINTYNDWWGTEYSMLSNVTDVGTILSDNGGAYFSEAIPDITSVRPDMFTVSKSKIIITTGTANNVFDGQTWQSGQAYILGDKVGYNSLVYDCILAFGGGATTPPNDAAHWALSVGEAVWQAQVGTEISSDATTFGSLFGVSGQIYLGYIILIAILGIALFGVSKGAGALGMMLVCIPLLLAGNFFRVVGIQITIIVSVAAIFLWVRQYWIKST